MSAPRYESNVQWQNAGFNQSMRPRRMYYPKSLADLVAIVQNAERDGARVKAVGGGHAYSDIALTDGYAVYTKSYNKFLTLDSRILKDSVQTALLVETEAGVSIQELIDGLEARGLALPNIGGHTVQAIMGAIATSTHGSGIDLGPLPDMVRSFVLVGAGGKVYRVEPEAGITDPAKHAQLCGSTIELVQNDDWFYSALVGVGCMGLVYSLVLEVLPMYNLTEVRRVSTWDVIKNELADESYIRRHRHLEVLINPYPNEAGKHTCTITSRDFAVAGEAIDESGRDSVWTHIINALPYHADYIAGWYFRTFPRKIPATLESGLREIAGRYTSRYHKVLRSGVDGIDGYAVEISYPMEKYAQAVEFIFRMAQKALEQRNERAEEAFFYITSPFSLRFVHGSKHYLSPQYGRTSCMLEMPFVLFPGFNVTKRSRYMMDFLQEYSYKLEGRPHWGLEFGNMKEDIVRKLYPKFDKWRAVHAVLNQSGVFNNGFSARIVPSKAGGSPPG